MLQRTRAMYLYSKILIVLLCLNAQSGFAADYTNEADYYQELPVVLTASRLSQPLSEAPNAMTVIDHQMIAASGFRNIADLFKLVPGMYVSYYKGSQAIVSYHGSTDQYARRMQVMIDGQSVYVSDMGTVSWADLPVTVDDIERIEVIRGPAAASYGANSTQGVISIITKNAGAMDGKSISVTHGNKGINDIAARFGSHGENVDYRMTVAYTADNGYDDLTTPPNGYTLTTFKAPGLLGNSNDSNQARMLNYRGDYYPNATDRVSMQFGFNHDVQGVGFNDKNTGTNFNTFHDLTGNSAFMQLGWIRALEAGDELSLHYYHMRHDQRESFPFYLGGKYFSGPVTQSTQTNRDEIELQHSLPFFNNNRLVYGAAWRKDQRAGQGFAAGLPTAIYQLYGLSPTNPAYSSSFNTTEYRLFAHVEWRFSPQWLVNAGSMLEKDGLGNTNVSPRIAVNFHATEHQTLRAGTSLAYRTPALAETNYSTLQPGALIVLSPTVTSPDLQPERLMSHEIGYLGEFTKLDTTVDLRLFSDYFTNGIYVPSNRTTIKNGVSANYQGFEATIKHQFDANHDLTVNFAHETASSNGVALGLVSSNPANMDILSASIPRSGGSVLYTQRMSHQMSLNISAYYQGGMQPVDRGIIDAQPAQRRLDIRLSRTFADGALGKGSVALVVQNLLNQDYTEYIASNLFNRRMFVTLTLNR
jgi:iron complex outermembrane receptor protein